MILTKEKEKNLAEHLFFQLWEESKGKELLSAKYALNSVLQSAKYQCRH